MRLTPGGGWGRDGWADAPVGAGEGRSGPASKILSRRKFATQMRLLCYEYSRHLPPGLNGPSPRLYIQPPPPLVQVQVFGRPRPPLSASGLIADCAANLVLRPAEETTG